MVVYSGGPAFMRAGGLDYLSRWLEIADAGTLPSGTPVASFAVRPEFPPEQFSDCNGNGVWDASTAEPYTDCNGNGTWDASTPELYTDTDGSGTWNVGEPFSDCNSNGLYDASAREPFTDCNGNGSYDASLAEAFTDLDGDGTFDALKTPPTSESLIVTASDKNLNRLCDDTAYEINQPEGTTFKMAYSGEPALPDRRGLSFGYQPCDSVTPANCAFDCSDATTPGGHCVMRSRVSGFSYGYSAGVSFTGGGRGDSDGGTEAWWEITLFGEKLQIPVAGTHQ